MSVKEVSLYFLGGVPIQYFGIDPIDPRSSLLILSMKQSRISWQLAAVTRTK